MTKTQNERIKLSLKALQAFEDAAKDLLVLWMEADIDGELLNSKYPFSKSFDEVVEEIKTWNCESITNLTTPPNYA